MGLRIWSTGVQGIGRIGWLGIAGKGLQYRVKVRDLGQGIRGTGYGVRDMGYGVQGMRYRYGVQGTRYGVWGMEYGVQAKL